MLEIGRRTGSTRHWATPSPTALEPISGPQMGRKHFKLAGPAQLARRARLRVHSVLAALTGHQSFAVADLTQINQEMASLQDLEGGQPPSQPRMLAKPGPPRAHSSVTFSFSAHTAPSTASSEVSFDQADGYSRQSEALCEDAVTLREGDKERHGRPPTTLRLGRHY